VNGGAPDLVAVPKTTKAVELSFEPIVADGHHFQFLPTGADAIAALELLIAGAQSDVSLEMYIYKADATGARIRAALHAACERGVRIRILLDDFGSGDLPRDYFADLQRHGTKLRFFNPSRVLRVAFRNHRKLCVADDRVAIVGGFNIGDEYAAMACTADGATSVSEFPGRSFGICCSPSIAFSPPRAWIVRH